MANKTKNNLRKKLTRAYGSVEYHVQTRKHAIIGIALVFTVVSIAYSSYIVWYGTTGVVPKLMLTPQMVLAAALLIWKFTKE